MKKPSFYISSPFDTYSGYGARSRDIIKAIIELDKYDVKLLSQRWGSTPFNFCTDHEDWSFLNELRVPGVAQGQKPDIWMQITIPSEYAPVGKFNIAGSLNKLNKNGSTFSNLSGPPKLKRITAFFINNLLQY